MVPLLPRWVAPVRPSRATRTASARLDLPEPFSPNRTVTPCRLSIVRLTSCFAPRNPRTETRRKSHFRFLVSRSTRSPLFRSSAICIRVFQAVTSAFSPKPASTRRDAARSSSVSSDNSFIRSPRASRSLGLERLYPTSSKTAPHATTKQSGR